MRAAHLREQATSARTELRPPSCRFVGNRPAGGLEAVVGALRDAAARAVEIGLTPARYRETRSVGMLVLEDERGSATRLAGDVQEWLERLGVYRRESRPRVPHLTGSRWRERPPPQPGTPPRRNVLSAPAGGFVSPPHPRGGRDEGLGTVGFGG